MNFSSMKSGDKKIVSTGDHSVTVHYHSRQSYGDNGKRVAGAVTGEFTVEYPNGRTSVHDHGPHATTEAAARRGANPNAKGMIASRAEQEVVSHLNSARMGFNDRR